MSKPNGRAELPDERGYIMVWRRIRDEIWPQGPYAVTLWLYLLLEASHRDGHRTTHGLILKRGQLHTSWIQLRRALSKPWARGATIPAEGTVRALIDRWLADGKLNLLADPLGLLITVCNYDRWQSADLLTEPLDDSLVGDRLNLPQEPTRTTRTTATDNTSPSGDQPTTPLGISTPRGPTPTEEAQGPTYQDELQMMWSDLVGSDCPFQRIGRLVKLYGSKITRRGLEKMWATKWAPEDGDGDEPYLLYLTAICAAKAHEIEDAEAPYALDGSVDGYILHIKEQMTDEQRVVAFPMERRGGST